MLTHTFRKFKQAGKAVDWNLVGINPFVVIDVHLARIGRSNATIKDQAVHSSLAGLPVQSAEQNVLAIGGPFHKSQLRFDLEGSAGTFEHFSYASNYLWLLHIYKYHIYIYIYSNIYNRDGMRTFCSTRGTESMAQMHQAVVSTVGYSVVLPQERASFPHNLWLWCFTTQTPIKHLWIPPLPVDCANNHCTIFVDDTYPGVEKITMKSELCSKLHSTVFYTMHPNGFWQSAPWIRKPSRP